MDDYTTNYLNNSFGHEFNEHFVENFHQHEQQHQPKTQYEIPLQGIMFDYDEAITTSHHQVKMNLFVGCFEKEDTVPLMKSMICRTSMRGTPNKTITPGT